LERVGSLTYSAVVLTADILIYFSQKLGSIRIITNLNERDAEAVGRNLVSVKTASAIDDNVLHIVGWKKNKCQKATKQKFEKSSLGTPSVITMITIGGVSLFTESRSGRYPANNS